MEDVQQGIKGGIMKIPKEFLLALVIIFIATFVMAGFSQEDKKESTPQEKTVSEQQEPGEKDLKPQEEKKPEKKKITPSEEAQKKYDEAELLRESQRHVDRAINILSLVAAFTCGLITLFGIAIMVAGLTGFFSYRRWAAIKKTVEEDVKAIKEDAKAMEEMKIKNQEYLAKLGKEIEGVSSRSLIEKPSQKIIENLENYNRRLEFVELLGLPLKAEDYINRGLNLINKNKYEHALTAFEKAIELEPNSFRAWLGKGIVLDKQEKYDEALIACEKTIELKPEEAFTWNNKGASLISLRRFEEALSPIEKALEIMPFYAVALANKGKALIGLERYDESLAAYKKALEIDSDIAEAWFNIACIYAIKKDKKNMLINLGNAVELDPKFKEEAKKDEDLKEYWGNEDFKKITS